MNTCGHAAGSISVFFVLRVRVSPRSEPCHVLSFLLPSPPCSGGGGGFGLPLALNFFVFSRSPALSMFDKYISMTRPQRQ